MPGPGAAQWSTEWWEEMNEKPGMYLKTRPVGTWLEQANLIMPLILIPKSVGAFQNT